MSDDATGIEDPQALARLADRAQATGRLALDTEFVGEGRYRTLLCLIQLAVGLDGERGTWIELVDPLQEGVDLSPLAGMLADPEIEVVVHAGRQDIALLRRALGCEVANVFDTQVAAAFTGLGAQISYDALLQATLGLRLAKSASFTRWERRPLSAEQLAYAREDVVHLLEAADVLERRLAERGRLDWARQECEPLSRASDERDPEAIFLRLPRIASTSAAAQGIARELVAWREATAERQDRPVQGVLSDPALMEIARRAPHNASELASIRGVGGGHVRGLGEAILRCVSRGGQRGGGPLPRPPRPRPADPDDAPIVALTEALIRARAREAELAYELITTRGEMQALVTARRHNERNPEIRMLKGWRRELLGQEVLALLEGQLALSVGEGRLRVGAPAR
jgi:ribonuclease D